MPPPHPKDRRRVASSLVLPMLFVLQAALAMWPASAWDADRAAVAAERLGPKAVAALPALRQLVAEAAALDGPRRLALVNDFFNRRVQFQDDAEVWGEIDHWASPLETLAQGQGDCEDYAIAKYFVLLAAGTPAAELRLVYVRAQFAGRVQAHMVLAHYASAGGDPHVLDNLVADVRPASRRPDLTAVFSFNSQGLWQGAGGQSAGDPLARLSRWREVLVKAQREGFL